ncbi:unnamed protein product [Ixodes pacificus]
MRIHSVQTVAVLRCGNPFFHENKEQGKRTEWVFVYHFNATLVSLKENLVN